MHLSKYICCRGAEKLEVSNAARVDCQSTWQMPSLAPIHPSFQTYQPVGELKASAGLKTFFICFFLNQNVNMMKKH